MDPQRIPMGYPWGDIGFPSAAFGTSHWIAGVPFG